MDIFNLHSVLEECLCIQVYNVASQCFVKNHVDVSTVAFYTSNFVNAS